MINKKIYIAIQYQDKQDIVQYANSIEHAKEILKIMPKLKTGYNYIII